MASNGPPLLQRVREFVSQTGIFSRPTLHLPGTAFAERAVHGHINPDHHTVASNDGGGSAAGTHGRAWPKFPSGRAQ